MNAEPAFAEIGHNNPPSEVEILRTNLLDRSEDIRARADELLSAFERVPAVIDNDDLCNRATDFVKQLQTAAAVTDKQRVVEKEPFLTSGRAVDAFFKPITDKLEQAKNTINKRISSYLSNKLYAEQKRRAEQQRLANEAAAKAAAEAAQAALQSQNEADTTAADKAAQKAEDLASRAAEVTTQPIAAPQARGDMAMASLRTVVDFEIIDRKKIDLEALRPYLAPAAIDTAIRGAIRAGERTINGVRIFETQKAVTR